MLNVHMLNLIELNIAFLKFYFTIEGASKKVPQFFMPTEQIYNKTFILINKNVYYEYCIKV